MAHFGASFCLSYSVHVVGTYFDGAAMIAQVGGSGHVELETACTEQLSVLAQQGPTTKWHLRRVEKIMEMLNAETPPMPKTPDEYPSWVEHISSRAYPKLKHNESGRSGYGLGWFLGSFVEHSNLAVFSLMLRDVQNAGEVFDGLVNELSTEIKSAFEGFVQTLTAEDIPKSVRPDLELVVKQMGQFPSLVDSLEEPLDIADDVQEVLYELGLIVERLENGFTVTW